MLDSPARRVSTIRYDTIQKTAPFARLSKTPAPLLTRTNRCEDVLITGVRIRANMKLPNADGIDLDRCRRVRISDCDIICADDGVSLKNCREFHEYGLCEDIGECRRALVRDCSLFDWC